MRHLIGRAEPAFRIYLAVSAFALNWIAIAMFVVMLASNAWNVLLRSTVGGGIMWHQEVSLMAAFWIYFAAYGLLGKDDAFVRIEALHCALPAAMRIANLAAVRLLTIGFHCVILWLCLKNFGLVSIYVTPILEWPEVVYYVPLAVGTADIVITEAILLLRLAVDPQTALRDSPAAASTA